MSYYRLRFPISVSGGVAKGDTGRLNGEVQNFRWYTNTADTGQPATLNLAVLPSESDSGVGWNFYAQSAVNLGAALTMAPRQPSHGADGAADPADTGCARSIK